MLDTIISFYHMSVRLLIFLESMALCENESKLIALCENESKLMRQ